ncbi:S8 family serine peptidase [Dyadobacter sp. CY323]|uniref:S8 family serine peptidase n=1 Tax=Dyadobacter sp. CY323 TaxID=2907302 RepID=UPI001F1E3C3C|nr:S8 family serine peptidase [Dyadobacter sp. CY323]MCE6988449.1 S8 family serine peptidase [Dyadobacter sp. CY323]
MLRSGAFTPEKNISAQLKGTNLRTSDSAKKSFVIIQFEEIPGADERRQLKEEGIDLLEYIPNFAYTATITGNGSGNALARTKGRSVIELSPEQKMQPGLANGKIPAHAIKVGGNVDVWISYPRSFKYSEISENLKEKAFDLISDQYKDYQILAVRVPISRLNELAGQPFIQYVQAVPQEDKPFNNRTFVNGRANVLASSLPIGRNLTGEGVVVGVGDEANPVQHIDFNNRVINRSALDIGTHGIHVMGTLGGAGIVNERFAGYAPKTTMVVQNFSNILAYSPQYVKDFGMVITNNSYGGDVNTCETFGVYDLYSYILDQHAFQMPYLQHVFAAGNSGTIACSPYPAGFGNILSGFQTAKNVISVGYTTDPGVIVNGSSKGPVRDGRIKPEITAFGSLVMSSIPVNLYGNGSGTSMSTPAVSGGLALLYQRYRQLHGGNPKNGLMKALISNGAEDKGNEGPDYKYGFGWLNLLRPLQMLESQHYVNDSLVHDETKSTSISVPSGTAQLKVMLYWNDPAAPVLSSQNLVHDLDLSVKKGNKTTLPSLLDPTPSKVNNVAGTGADHVNNMEQVIINNPTEGDYTILVKGTSVAQNPVQEYFVVYDVIPNVITLTYPIGNEKLRDGDGFSVSWDAYGNVTSTFTVQYSLNDGGSWTTIGSNLAANLRQFAWTIPAGTVSDKAKVKVIQNSTGAESVSAAFTIVGIPTITLSALQCESYISVDWSAAVGATDYEVMVLKGSEMVSVGTTTSTNFVLSGLSKDSTYFVSVRARINGNPGRRAVAISRKPDSGTCQGSISNYDFKIESILTPTGSGRKHTSSELGNAVFVKIRIKNLDDVDLNEPIDVGYELDGVSIPIETITPFIEKGKTYDHTFSVGANLSNVGSYTFKIYIHNSKDQVTSNDTLVKTFRQLPNDALALPFLDDMENLPVQTVVTSQTGLIGDGRYDFSASSDAGRIRTFVNSGIASSGQKALTLDVNRYFSAGNTNYLEGTFNLGAFDMEDADIRLNFLYKNHGQKTNANNKVWIRGKDTDPWIEAYDLFANQSLSQDGYKATRGIELSNLLSANGKNFSSSFQIRLGQWGKMITADYANGAGYSFDDIEIYAVIDDIQMIGIVSPAAESCGLGNEEPITIKIRNSSASAISNVPVVYQLGNGEVFQDIIPSIAKRTTIDFTFSKKANLSAFGEQKIKVWAALNSDGYHDNDSVSVSHFNAPLISSFPYIENFENGDGFWFAKGLKSSWQHGTPVSAVIKTAASGTKIWKTNLAGGHNNREESYLYSPCLAVSGLAAPTLSFSVALDFETCDPTPCDIAYLEYSGNGGPWKRLGTVGQGTNWYNKTYSGNGAWSVVDNTRWHVATVPLPTGFSNLKIRFAMVSDGSTQREGIAVDDIHVYDKANNIYDGESMASPVSQTVSAGTNWVHFLQNGQLLASINPNNQNLGNTGVQAFINAAPVRNANNQYYLNRSFTIHPQTSSLTDSATVRFYILDSETEALVNATGCGSCGKPVNAYDLGISKFRHPQKVGEDGSLGNNSAGTWSFHSPEGIAKVPYDKGYYLEMKLKSFSEFWFSKGFVGTTNSLPVNLISFDAKKKPTDGSDNNVILEWTTSSEENFDHFDLEVAIGNEAYRLDQFVKFARVSGYGGLKTNSQYTFIDTDPAKSGVRYYRLRMVDRDSTFAFSRVRPVVFDEMAEWTVYPNPSKGLFFVNYQADAGKEVSVNIYDLNGRLFRKASSVATGFLQKSKVDITGNEFTGGIYVLEIDNGKEKRAFQVLKD